MQTPSVRDELLQAATRVFAEHGKAGATTKRIAQEANVNEITLFRHFGSKDQLLRLALETRVAEMEKVCWQFSGNMRTDLLSIVRTYDQMLSHNTQLMLTYLTEVMREPQLVSLLPFPTIVNDLTSQLERFQSEGSLLREDPLQQLAALLGPVLSTHMFRAVGMPVQNFSAKEHIDRFLTGRCITARNAPPKEDLKRS